MRYVLVNNTTGLVEVPIELDPTNLYDGTPWPLPPVVVVPGEVGPVLDEEGNPELNEDGTEKTIQGPDTFYQPPAGPDPRYRIPAGYSAYQSDTANGGDTWPTT